MKAEIEKAVEVLKNGGVILYPTDTIWGLGCDPTNDRAIEKLLAIKKRAANKSLILLVHNEALLQRYAKTIPDVCYDLIDFAVKPLTIVYPDGQHVSDYVLGPDKSVAIRITKDPFCVQLIQKLKAGLVSTSANISNQPYSNNLADIDEEIKNRVDYIVDLPLQDKSGHASQIIKIGADGQVTIIRK